MRMLIGFVILLCSMAWGVNEVTNVDQPVKGEWNFSLVKDWQVDILGNDFLNQVSNITMDEKGTIFVLDSKLNKIFILSPQGKLLGAFGKPGEGPGEFKFVLNFFLVEDVIIVPDIPRLHYFDKYGQFKKSITLNSIQIPKIFIDVENLITTSDFSMGEKQKKSGKIKIFNISKNTSKTLVKLASQEGILNYSSGDKQVVLKLPGTLVETVLVYAKPFYYYAVNDCYEIYKIDSQGKQVMKIALEGRKRGKNSESAKKGLFEKMKLSDGRMNQDMINRMVQQIPDDAFYFDRIVVAENGFLYVFIPELGQKHSVKIDIFSPEGQYVYRAILKLSDGYTYERAFFMKNGTLLVFVEDEKGENYLVKYKYQSPK